jgi:hypothetical protein
MGMTSRAASTELARLGRQAEKLKGDFVGSHAHIRNRRLVWLGDVQPSPLSRKYRLVVELDGAAVRVQVLPKLARPEKVNLPHVFNGRDLCLYFEGEWDSDMALAETIVPWASEWLLHYEFWLITGKWGGGGHGSNAINRESA